MKIAECNMFTIITLSLVMAHVLCTQAYAKHVTTVLDVSGSNYLFEDKALNSAAADYVKAKIDALSINDKVSVRFIGSLSNTKSLQRIEHTITHHNKGIVKKLVPQLVQGMMTHIEPQSSTNIIAFFNRHAFDCDEGDEIILLTDGIEASEYVNPTLLLAGKAEMPPPSEFVSLEGCTVVFYGIGAMRSDTELTILRQQWQRYFDAAGATFKAIAL